MRFTASKEAGDPDAHFVCSAGKTSLIGIKEFVHVLIKLFGHNVLVQLLINILLILLANLDDALDITADFFIKHILDFHIICPLLITVSTGKPGNNFHHESFQTGSVSVYSSFPDRT